MTNYNLEEADLIKLQIILSTVLIFTTIISISLSYNFLMTLENKEPIYDEDDSYNILVLNRTLMFIVGAIFIYINVKDKMIKEKYKLEDEFADLQIWASVFSFVATFIVLYVGINSVSNFISEENPII